jgi:hypothetical protein
LFSGIASSGISRPILSLITTSYVPSNGTMG